MKRQTNQKPQTDLEWAVYRCKASCRVGLDSLTGKIPSPVTPINQAVYTILHAIQDLAEAIELLSKQQNNTDEIEDLRKDNKEMKKELHRLTKHEHADG